MAVLWPVTSKLVVLVRDQSATEDMKEKSTMFTIYFAGCRCLGIRGEFLSTSVFE